MGSLVLMSRIWTFPYIDSYIDGRIYVVDFTRRRLRNYKKYYHLERFLEQNKVIIDFRLMNMVTELHFRANLHKLYYIVGDSKKIQMINICNDCQP